MWVLNRCWCRCTSGGSYWVILQWIWGSRRSSLGIIFRRLAGDGGRSGCFCMFSHPLAGQYERTLGRCRLGWSSGDRSVSSGSMSPFPNSNNIRLLWFPTGQSPSHNTSGNTPQVHPIPWTSQDKLDIIVIITITFILHIFLFYRSILWSLLNYSRGWVNTICCQRPGSQLHTRLVVSNVRSHSSR
jgi:hypothetical protein